MYFQYSGEYLSESWSTFSSAPLFETPNGTGMFVDSGTASPAVPSTNPIQKEILAELRRVLTVTALLISKVAVFWNKSCTAKSALLGYAAKFSRHKYNINNYMVG